MPRILRILNRFNLGGPVHNAAYLTRYLSSGWRTLLVGGPPEAAEADATDLVTGLGIEPRLIPQMRRAVHPANDILAYRQILRIIDDFKPDIVHTHASKAGTIGRLAAVARGVKTVVHTFHGHVFDGYFNPAKTRLFIRIERALAYKTSRIIALSGSQRHDLSKTYAIAPPERIAVVPLGLDLAPFRADKIARRTAFRGRFDIGDDEIAVGIIGRLVPVKDHALFLEGIRRALRQTGKPLRAFIIGDGELKDELIRRCRDLGMSWAVAARGQVPRAAVTFTSWINPIHDAYPGLDIVAMTSRNEGTPVSLIEAQACGVPIVTAGVGGIEDIVLPGRTALVFRNGDVTDFAQKLSLMAEKVSVRRVPAEYGWDHVKNRFHYRRLVSDMEKVYASLLRGK